MLFVYCFVLQQITDLKDEQALLETRKDSIVRQQKLMTDESHSRFANHPVLHNRYLLLQMLGKGGFSEVYKVRVDPVV